VSDSQLKPSRYVSWKELGIRDKPYNKGTTEGNRLQEKTHQLVKKQNTKKILNT